MTDSTHPLGDPMGGRPLAARWAVRGTLTLETAMHLGGEATESVDLPVLRDPRGGRPLLPGTTLAGALRTAFAGDTMFIRGKENLYGIGAKQP